MISIFTIPIHNYVSLHLSFYIHVTYMFNLELYFFYILVAQQLINSGIKQILNYSRVIKSMFSQKICMQVNGISLSYLV